MENQQQDPRSAELENLEAAVRELTEVEMAQVEGGYVGTANGGVWKTTNGGQTWTNTTTSRNQISDE